MVNIQVMLVVHSSYVRQIDKSLIQANATGDEFES